jgi:hypothetical protein
MKTMPERMTKEQTQEFRDELLLAVQRGYKTSTEVKKYLKTKKNTFVVAYHLRQLVESGDLQMTQAKARGKMVFSMVVGTTHVTPKKANKPALTTDDAYDLVRADMQKKADELQAQLDRVLELLTLLR